MTEALALIALAVSHLVLAWNVRALSRRIHGAQVEIIVGTAAPRLGLDDEDRDAQARPTVN